MKAVCMHEELSILKVLKFLEKERKDESYLEKVTVAIKVVCPPSAPSSQERPGYQDGRL